MSAMASQITSLTIVYSTIHSGADQRSLQSSASLAFVRGIHLWPVNSPHKEPVTRKMFSFDDVIICVVCVFFSRKRVWRWQDQNLFFFDTGNLIHYNCIFRSIRKLLIYGPWWILILEQRRVHEWSETYSTNIFNSWLLKFSLLKNDYINFVEAQWNRIPYWLTLDFSQRSKSMCLETQCRLAKSNDLQGLVMTSWHGRAFRITKPLTDKRSVNGDFSQNSHQMWSFDVFFVEQTVKKHRVAVDLGPINSYATPAYWQNARLQSIYSV